MGLWPRFRVSRLCVWGWARVGVSRNPGAEEKCGRVRGKPEKAK